MKKFIGFSLFMIALAMFITSSDLYSQNCKGKGACNGKQCCDKFVDANGDGKCDNFIDANNDGKCDNCKGMGKCDGTKCGGTGKCNGQGKGCMSGCSKFVDANGDGKCDNFLDANKDGKCDNCTGKGKCNGTGSAKCDGTGKGKAQSKGCVKGCVMPKQNKTDFNINQNSPNPVIAKTKITVNLKENNSVKVVLFDYSGNKIKDVFEGNLHSGDNEVEFSVDGIQPGNYFYAVEVSGKIQTKQLIIIK